MRQVAITKHGPPEVLQAAEAPDPVPRAGEVRIAVAASGVNFADIMARLGLYPDAPPPPVVVGYEVAGAIDALGSADVPFHIGDRVFAFTRFGGYASSVVVPAASVFRTPATLTDVEAAAVPVNYLTAFIALYKCANVEAGETVLIHGAGGGVGVAATQLAKRRGAIVIGTASAMKLTAIRGLGVDHALDHQNDDVPRAVRELTAGRGADVVLDSIGGRSFRISYGLLAPLGRLVMFGASSIASGERRRLWSIVQTLITMPTFKPLSLLNRNRGVFGLNLLHLVEDGGKMRAGMDQLIAELTAGTIHPVVARTFPLDRAGDAHRYMQSRANIGKVILTV
jgi:NADPH:quinone reductase-like Zn-dependent oxidoreductase